MMHPQRVVSLWDMLKGVSSGFLTAISNTVRFGDMVREANRGSTSAKIFPEYQYYAMIISMRSIAENALVLGLPVTHHSSSYCVGLLERASVGNGGYILEHNNTERLEWELHTLYTSIVKETEMMSFFVLDGPYASYIVEGEPVFGKEVEDAFPRASEDLSEAAKCLAVERYTATVFHLMRAMECALQYLASSHGVVVGAKAWGPILSAMNTEIQALPKGQERDAWSQVHTHLYHVKQAWRNDTMHPKTTYTQEQATSVFEAVKSFMIALAPMVSVPGKP